MIDFEEAVQDALESAEDDGSHIEEDPAVFHPSQLVRCDRRAYCSKLGIDDQRDILGTFRTGTLIHEFLEDHLALPEGVVFEEDTERHTNRGITIKGRADVIDREAGVVYDFKTRSGWYKFDPPNQRHCDQLHLYMACLDGVDRARVVYLSKKDMEVRQWPEDSLFSFDAARVDALLARAERIRDVIEADGPAGSADEIPFEKCDCYFCSQETLRFGGEGGE